MTEPTAPPPDEEPPPTTGESPPSSTDTPPPSSEPAPPTTGTTPTTAGEPADDAPSDPAAPASAPEPAGDAPSDPAAPPSAAEPAAGTAPSGASGAGGDPTPSTPSAAGGTPSPTPVPDVTTASSPPPVQARAQLVYSPADNGLSAADEKIPLQFNPEAIKITRNVKFKEDAPINTKDTNTESGKAQLAVQNREEQLKQQGATIISIGQILFDGKDAKTYADQLLNWMEPVQSASGKPEGKNARVVSFVWGKLNYRCKLENVALTFIRFSSDGLPTRVKVDLTLREQPPKKVGTNPTSGGLTGRRSHVVLQGENLQGVAYATYGDASAWRAIAALNGIDDPFRLAPGAEIYLPNGDELIGGARA
jgi:hypothetical protein